MTSRTDIQKYSRKNSSGKIPLEAKMIEAYVNSILNSTDVENSYELLREKVWNELKFFFFNSLWSSCAEYNKEPYRSLIAYSMLRKDVNLFDMILYKIFGGKGFAYHNAGSNIGSDIYFDKTDETYKPDGSDSEITVTTDLGTTTDPIKGIITEVFFLDYSENFNEYPTSEELDETLNSFYKLLTIVKPARVNICFFLEPYCMIRAKKNGNALAVESYNIQTISQYLTVQQFSNVLNTAENQLGKLFTSIVKTDESGISTTLKDVWMRTGVQKFIKYSNGDVSLTYERKISIFDDDSDRTLEQKTWGNLTMVHGLATVRDIKFTPKIIKRQSLSNTYYIRICLYFIKS